MAKTKTGTKKASTKKPTPGQRKLIRQAVKVFGGKAKLICVLEQLESK